MSETSAGEERQVVTSSAGSRAAVIKLLVELGPLVAFFVAWATLGIYWATGTIMVTTLLSLVVSLVVLKKISPVPVVTAVVVCVFGGLTLYFHDPRFFYAKPTIINLLFGGVLASALYSGKPVLKSLLGSQVHLSDDGWRKLTQRWMLFFLALACLNELVVHLNGLHDPVLIADKSAREIAEKPWVYFKFSILPLTMIFAVAQTGLLKRYELNS